MSECVTFACSLLYCALSVRHCLALDLERTKIYCTDSASYAADPSTAGNKMHGGCGSGFMSFWGRGSLREM